LSAGQNYFAFHFLIQPGWHIYWKNPGDSGAAPNFELLELTNTRSSGQVQDQVKTQKIQISWPYPERIPVGTFFNYGYETEVAFPFEHHLHEMDVARGNLSLNFRLEWLACKVECVPGQAHLSIDLPTGMVAKLDLKNKPIIRKYLAQSPIPRDIFAEEGWLSPQYLQVRSELLEGDVDWTTVFPHSSSPFQNQAPEVDWTQGALEFLVPRIKGKQAHFPQTFLVVQGLVNGEVRSYDLVVKSAKEVSSLPTRAESNAESQADRGGIHSAQSPARTGSALSEGLLQTLLLFAFAFMGGFILNLMPCVFPVLSIKIFSLLKTNGKKSSVVAESLAYFFGVIATFLLLGGVFLALRQLGQNIGWGFQLQSPYFVYVMCIVFFALALNFLGLFDVGESLVAWAGQKSHEKSSSFLTGALSVFVATPCTGPFMGSALGATVSLSAPEALGIFLFLGIGMGSPFLLLSLFPRWMQFLPKPGAWMVNVKEFFSFPLFATVLWLSWILIRQIGTGAMLPVGLAVLGMSFFVWMKSKTNHRKLKRLFVVMALGAAVGPLYLISTEANPIKQVALPSDADSQSSSPTTSAGADESAWSPYSESKLAGLRSRGVPVFIDFTADWCITCQWNKKIVLEKPEILRLFKKNNVYLMRADWTNQDKAITLALANFGRASVPVYAFYAAGSKSLSEPRLLPQILTTDIIENLFKVDE
jgi:thiol:disulfide interchange protein DsbD